MSEVVEVSHCCVTNPYFSYFNSCGWERTLSESIKGMGKFVVNLRYDGKAFGLAGQC